jgi:AraC-like DNA-binding protein
VKAVFEKINNTSSIFKRFNLDVSYFDAPWHYHPERELVYFEEGCGKQFIGDHVQNFKAGDLVLIGSNVPHFWISDPQYYKKELNLRSKAKVVQFPRSFPGEILEIPEMHKVKKALINSSRGLLITGTAKKKVIDALNYFFKADGLKTVQEMLSILEIIGGTSEYALLASSGFSESFIPPADSKIEAAYSYIMQYYNSSVLIEDVAEHVGMHPTAFCRYFKSRAKMTFIDFLIEVRIGYACKLLMESNYSITQTCFESGFNNISNFNRHFKKIKGITPKEFRKEFQVIYI